MVGCGFDSGQPPLPEWYRVAARASGSGLPSGKGFTIALSLSDRQRRYRQKSPGTLEGVPGAKVAASLNILWD